MVERARLYRVNNRDKVNARKRGEIYKSRYNFSIEGYDVLLQVQNGVCAVCGGGNLGKKYFSVDYNHKTGRVRGLLCGNCNTAIGLVKENEQTLANMIAYLKKHNGM